MASKAIDGVIEAVHNKPDGQIDWVRLYLRRGPTFSDRIIINRAKLISIMKPEKNFVTGKRIPYQASTFVVDKQLQLVQKDDRVYVTTGDISTENDYLEGVPII